MRSCEFKDLGKVQQGIAHSLVQHGQWTTNQRSGWDWGTPSKTKGLLDSLVRRGWVFAEDVEDGFTRYTPTARLRDHFVEEDRKYQKCVADAKSGQELTKKRERANREALDKILDDLNTADRARRKLILDRAQTGYDWVDVLDRCSRMDQWSRSAVSVVLAAIRRRLRGLRFRPIHWFRRHDRFADSYAPRVRALENEVRRIFELLARRCDACGEDVPAKAIRPWACSPRCYAELMGIDDGG